MTTRNRKVRVAFVGVGRQAQEHRIPGFLQLVLDGQVEVVAVCDGVREQADRVARMFAVPGSFGPWHERDAGVRPSYASVLGSAFPVPRSYGSLAEMIEGERQHGGIDLAVVCVPHHDHAEVTVEALEAEIHVLCEKPMATSLDDAQRMVEKARARQRVLGIGYQYGYGVHPWVFERIAEIGATRRVSLRFLLEDNVPDKVEYLTAAGVWDDLPGHPVSAVLPMLGGRPVSVRAGGSGHWIHRKHGTGIKSVDTASAVISMSDGVDVDLNVSWKAGVNAVGATIVGDGGELDVTLLARELDGSKYPARLTRRVGDLDVVEVGPPAVLYTEAIAAQHTDIVLAVRDRVPLRFGADHAFDIEKIIHSGRSSIHWGDTPVNV